jgi:predicted RNA-binding protein with RPS1 domain
LARPAATLVIQQGHENATSLRFALLEIADCAAQIADPDYEAYLLTRRRELHILTRLCVGDRLWKHVGDLSLSDLTFRLLCRSVEFQALRRAPRSLSGGAPDHAGGQDRHQGPNRQRHRTARVIAEKFVDDTFGLPTVTDILRELEKPGRDPRPAFKAAAFMEGVETINDLKPGMVLEGAVTNVAAFGAFVDVGVHQDGLVHVSAMSKTFVKDPREVVKPGDIVRVKVLEVDMARKRIALTLRLDDEVGPRADRAGIAAPRNDDGRPPPRVPSSNGVPVRHEKQGGGALADALRRAGLAQKRK